MKVKANQQGFTLIELVVVIVILGILAVTAAPRFIDLTSDAKSSVVQAVRASLSSARDLAHAKALVKGNLGDDMSIAGENIPFANGYPTAAGIALLMDVDITSETSDAVFVLDTTGNAATYSYKGVTDPTTCQAVYNETSDQNDPPEVTATTSGC
jgi:MSHA pilin protein MshA